VQIGHAILVAIVCAAGPSMAADGELQGKELIRALRQGGHNIYFRHTQTDWSQIDIIVNAGDWTDCDPSRVRQLSDAGRQTARAIGAAMRALRIPVSRVLASPYCRTVDTATLMDLAPVKTMIDVINMRVAEYVGGTDAVVATARKRLAGVPPTGTNIVIVAHGNVIRSAARVNPMEGEGLVFRPDGDGEFALVGRLTPEQWEELAGSMSGTQEQ
jgi:broad specificity phosphatase PhoE